MVHEMANIAMVYDMDYTLCSRLHPDLVLQNRGIDAGEFWNSVNQTQLGLEKQDGRKNHDILYVSLFLQEIYNGKLKGLTIEELKATGESVKEILYPGLPEFFSEIKTANPDKNISHNIVTVGLQQLLEGSAELTSNTDQIRGYILTDSLTPGRTIDGIAATMSANEKIPAIVGLSYGRTGRRNFYEFPIQNMIYIGDGLTDVPAFRFVRKRGGTAICVYDTAARQSKFKAEDLAKEVDYVAPANYERQSQLWNIVMDIIAQIHEH